MGLSGTTALQAVIVGSLALGASTRFDPALDAPPIPNSGDYASAGDCLALSLLALDAFAKRMNGAPADYSKATEPTLKATAGKLQEQLRREWDERRVNAGNPRRPWSDPSVGQEAFDAIRGGQPVILDFTGRLPTGDTGSHAVIAYGYRDGKFVLWDPDHPSEPHTLEWDPERGFGAFSQPGRVYPRPISATVRAPGEFESAAKLDELRAACRALAASCMDRYRPTSVTATVEGDRLVVRGQLGAVPAGVTPVQDGFFIAAAIRVNGEPLEAVRVLPDGSFVAKVPAATLGGRPGVVEVEVKKSDGGLVGIGRASVAPGPSRTKGIARAVGR